MISISSFLEILSLAVFIYSLVLFLIKLVNNIGTFCFGLGRVDDFKSRYGGDWALITGGTDGIGRAYACELASRGLNLVLVSNRPEQAEETVQYLRDKFGVRVKFIEADFRGISYLKIFVF